MTTNTNKQQGGELPQDERAHQLLACVNRAIIGLRDGWGDRNDADEAIKSVAEIKEIIAQRAASVPDAGLMSKLPELRELAHSVLGNCYLGQDREKELAELLLAAAPQTTEKK